MDVLYAGIVVTGLFWWHKRGDGENGTLLAVVGIVYTKEDEGVSGGQGALDSDSKLSSAPGCAIGSCSTGENGGIVWSLERSCIVSLVGGEGQETL